MPVEAAARANSCLSFWQSTWICKLGADSARISLADGDSAARNCVLIKLPGIGGMIGASWFLWFFHPRGKLLFFIADEERGVGSAVVGADQQVV